MLASLTFVAVVLNSISGWRELPTLFQIVTLAASAGLLAWLAWQGNGNRPLVLLV